MSALVDITAMPGDAADSIGVNRFARAMQRKMEAMRTEGRYGWNRPNLFTISKLKARLASATQKGDPVDVANYAMMIWNRQHPTG